MHDEDLAIIEIRQLSNNAKMFLQHELRSALTIFMIANTDKKTQTIADEIWLLKSKLTKWGI